MENIPTISKTGLDLIDISPLDYWWRYLNPNRVLYTPDKTAIFDTALRSAVFTPKEFSIKYVKAPSTARRSDAAKMEHAAIHELANKNGQIVLSASDFLLVHEMASALNKNPTFTAIIENGTPGSLTKFTEPLSGVSVSFTPHWIFSDRLIVNLTSTTDASTANFQKEAWNFKYHKKHAIQCDGMNMPAMAFVCIEKTEPYKIGLHYLDAQSVDLGRATYVKNCETYMRCLKENKWPGLPPEIVGTGLPEWVYKIQK